MPGLYILKKIRFTVLALFAILVGLYPLLYLIMENNVGLLATKSEGLIANRLWNLTFYTHIYFGGIALLIGWLQFSQKLRERYTGLHRGIGMVYVLSIALSGLAAFYLAFYATGGLVSGLGFGTLAVLWLFTTTNAFVAIKKRQVVKHRQWMIRSYSLTFAAVSLRLWMPFFIAVMSVDFFVAYAIIAWLCWVPNILIAEWVIRKKNRIIN